MNAIEKMLTGTMPMSEFLRLMKTDSQIQEQLRNLVPQDAVDNPEHELWKKYSYRTAAKYHFDVYEILRSHCRFDLSPGDNLNIFGTIRRFYCCTHPTLVCTTQYEDAHGLYLDVIKDCYDGPEVRRLMESIIQSALPLKTKKARIAQARQELACQFHLTDKKRPRWIQGPEWPMGQSSPMEFISQKRSGERVEYIFEDFDTKEQRIVVQHY